MPQFAEDDRVLKHVLRVANSWVDCSLLSEKYHDEKIVVEHTAEVERHILDLLIHVVAVQQQCSASSTPIQAVRYKPCAVPIWSVTTMRLF